MAPVRDRSHTLREPLRSATGGILLRIRLTRMGAKKKPFYRVVVIERREARDGSFVEIVGHYNPSQSPPSVVLDMERVRHWIGRGAQPSETVHSLLKKAAPPASSG